MHVRFSRSFRGPAPLAAVAALAALAVVASPARAEAQPGAPPPPPPPPGAYGGYGRGYYYRPPPLDPTRRGFTGGVGIGFGLMDSDSNLTRCIDCNFDPIAWAFDLHLGAMLTPRLALLGELFFQAQTIDADGFNWLSQTMVLGAAQFWLTPQFWVKGGVGFASLASHYDDGFYANDDEIDTGVALMGAVGYEIFHSPWFAVDLQGRLASGNYKGVDERVNAGTIGIGFNWY